MFSASKEVATWRSLLPPVGWRKAVYGSRDLYRLRYQDLYRAHYPFAQLILFGRLRDLYRTRYSLA